MYHYAELSYYPYSINTRETYTQIALLVYEVYKKNFRGKGLDFARLFLNFVGDGEKKRQRTRH